MVGDNRLFLAFYSDLHIVIVRHFALIGKTLLLDNHVGHILVQYRSNTPHKMFRSVIAGMLSLYCTNLAKLEVHFLCGSGLKLVTREFDLRGRSEGTAGFFLCS